MNEEVKLFRQAMEILSMYEKAAQQLQEAEKLLKEWQKIIHDRMTANSGVDAYHVIRLEERTEKFLEKEGKNG